MNDFEIKTLAEEIWFNLKNEIPNSPITYITIALTQLAKRGYKESPLVGIKCPYCDFRAANSMYLTFHIFEKHSVDLNVTP